MNDLDMIASDIALVRAALPLDGPRWASSNDALDRLQMRLCQEHPIDAVTVAGVMRIASESLERISAYVKAKGAQ